MHICNIKRVLLKDGHNKTIPTPHTNKQTNRTTYRQWENKDAGWGGGGCGTVTEFRTAGKAPVHSFTRGMTGKSIYRA